MTIELSFILLLIHNKDTKKNHYSGCKLLRDTKFKKSIEKIWKFIKRKKIRTENQKIKILK